LETKDSSSADHYLPNNKVRGRPPQNDQQWTCHSEGARRSLTEPGRNKLQEMLPKDRATEESPVQAGTENQLDFKQQKKQTLVLETKDSSSADHYLPNN
jgi:hypothetical protein